MPDSDFVLVRVSGSVNDNQFMQHVIDFKKETSNRQVLKELADCRAVTDITGVTAQGFILSSHLEESILAIAGSKLAILVANDLHYGMANAYRMISAMKHREIGIFYELEEALEWLGVQEPFEEIEQIINSPKNRKRSSFNSDIESSQA